MLYLANAFSLNMLDRSLHAPVIVPADLEAVKDSLQHETFTSVVGHPDTAALFAALLDVDVPCNRTSVRLQHGDILLVGQYTGPRLPEGATTLPEGASIEWWQVSIGR